MSRNYAEGSSDNYYGKGRSKANLKGSSSSRKSRSGNNDTKPELETKLYSGYNRPETETRLDGNIPGQKVQLKTRNKKDIRPERLVVLSKQYQQELHGTDRQQESLGDKFDNCWRWSKARGAMNEHEGLENKQNQQGKS